MLYDEFKVAVGRFIHVRVWSVGNTRSTGQQINGSVDQQINSQAVFKIVDQGVKHQVRFLFSFMYLCPSYRVFTVFLINLDLINILLYPFVSFHILINS